jgi:phage/plasmid-associated DNA primase
MISGETISVARKFKDPISVPNWQVQGMGAGNCNPAFVDNAGSVARRIVCVRFGKQIVKGDGDTRLGDTLRQEAPAVLIKCVRMYLEAVNMYCRIPRPKLFWEICPSYFQKQRDEMTESTNALIAFMKSDQVVLQADTCVPYADFQKAYKAYALQNNMPYKTLNKDEYNGPFQDMGIKYTEDQPESREYPRGSGKMRKCKFIHGCDLVNTHGS